jgi:hypothetical protein
MRKKESISMTDSIAETTETQEARPENTPVTGGARDPATGKFPKGRSGNPGGRPKVEGRIRKLAQKHSSAAIKRLAELMESKNERVAVAACEAMLDRGIGKPRQAVEISTDPERPPPQFGISFALGGPGNPLSPEEAKAAEAAPGSEFGVEVSGDLGAPGELEADESPLALPHASQSVRVEPPRLPPDPARPNAVTIDQHDGAVWASLVAAAAGVSMPEPSRAQSAAKHQAALESRRREHQERNEEENQRTREAARAREMRKAGEYDRPIPTPSQRSNAT